MTTLGASIGAALANSLVSGSNYTIAISGALGAAFGFFLVRSLRLDFGDLSIILFPLHFFVGGWFAEDLLGPADGLVKYLNVFFGLLLGSAVAAVSSGFLYELTTKRFIEEAETDTKLSGDFDWVMANTPVLPKKAVGLLLMIFIGYAYSEAFSGRDTDPLIVVFYGAVVSFFVIAIIGRRFRRRWVANGSE